MMVWNMYFLLNMAIFGYLMLNLGVFQQIQDELDDLLKAQETCLASKLFGTFLALKQRISTGLGRRTVEGKNKHSKVIHP